MIDDKLPPYDLPAEESVLGSLLIDGEMIAHVDSFLKPDDFFSEQNKLIYEVCRRLYDRNVSINQITVAQELAHDNKLELVGGASYLSHLVSIVPTSLHIEDYGQIVSRLATMRRLISAAAKISAIGYRADPNVDDALIEAEDILFKVKERKERGDFVPIQDVLRDYFDETRRPDDTDYERSRYLPTGFAAIDNLLIGMQRSNLIILAARTSMGKTSLALNIARNAALNDKACVALFSLEMSKQELVQRLLSSEARVPSQRVRLGNFTEDEQERIMTASGELGKGDIFIDDSPMLKTMEMRSKTRQLHFVNELDLVVVDYLQLIRSDGRSETRALEVGDITRSLKSLAREMDVPVLALSQLSRAPERRESHKPQLSDLRESGSIEQDADVVILMDRADKGMNKEEWDKEHILDGEPYPEGVVDVNIAKHRNGPTGEVKLQFDARITRFRDFNESRPIPSL